MRPQQSSAQTPSLLKLNDIFRLILQLRFCTVNLSQHLIYLFVNCLFGGVFQFNTSLLWSLTVPLMNCTLKIQNIFLDLSYHKDVEKIHISNGIQTLDVN